MKAEQHRPEQIWAEFMKGCSIEDLYFLLDFDQLQECVYKLYLLAKKVNVGASELPWPLCAFLAKFESDMLQATRRLLRIAKAKRGEWKNQYPLITWSLTLRASHSCSVLPNDK